MEIEINESRVGEILGGLKHILNVEVERHGNGPIRHYEMLNAMAILIASMVVAAPNTGAEREAFVSMLDKYITEVTQNVRNSSAN